MFQRINNSGMLDTVSPAKPEVKEAEACSIRKGKGGRGYSVTTHRKGKAVTAKFKSRKAALKQQRAIQFFKRQG